MVGFFRDLLLFDFLTSKNTALLSLPCFWFVLVRLLFCSQQQLDTVFLQLPPEKGRFDQPRKKPPGRTGVPDRGIRKLAGFAGQGLAEVWKHVVF